MFVRNVKEATVAKAVYAIAVYMQQMTTDPTMSIDRRMELLQWIYKKIPEINRLLVQIKTEQINGTKRD